MSQALGAEKVEVAFWSSKKKTGPRQTVSVGSNAFWEKQRERGKAEGTGYSQVGCSQVGCPGSKGQEKMTKRWGLPRVAVERRGHLLR